MSIQSETSGGSCSLQHGKGQFYTGLLSSCQRADSCASSGRSGCMEEIQGRATAPWGCRIWEGVRHPRTARAGGAVWRLMVQTALKAVLCSWVALPCLCRRELLRAENHVFFFFFFLINYHQYSLPTLKAVTPGQKRIISVKLTVKYIFIQRIAKFPRGTEHVWTRSYEEGILSAGSWLCNQNRSSQLRSCTSSD